MATPIDPTQAARYPVILSDELLGKGSREKYTNVKYNYVPKPVSETSQGDAIIQASDPPANKYDLTLTESNEEYAYHGSRQSGEGQYVLVFSPERKAFILHKIDSTFNMNVSSTPWDQDQDSLRTTYPQLGPTANLPQVGKEKAEPKRGRKAEAKPRGPAKSQSKMAAKGLPKAPAKAAPKKAKAPARREPTPEEEEESDDGLTIEYPDGPPMKPTSHHLPMVRSEPVLRAVESEEEESGNEEERDRDVEAFRLPSPAGGHEAVANEEEEEGGGEEEQEGDFVMDLEAELEQALVEQGNEGDQGHEGNPGNEGDESSESEEE